MEDKPMRELHTLYTKIKNIPMDLPKRSDNDFESNREQLLSANLNISSNIITKENQQEKC